MCFVFDVIYQECHDGLGHEIRNIDLNYSVVAGNEIFDDFGLHDDSATLLGLVRDNYGRHWIQKDLWEVSMLVNSRFGSLEEVILHPKTPWLLWLAKAELRLFNVARCQVLLLLAFFFYLFRFVLTSTPYPRQQTLVLWLFGWSLLIFLL